MDMIKFINIFVILIILGILVFSFYFFYSVEEEVVRKSPVIDNETNETGSNENPETLNQGSLNTESKISGSEAGAGRGGGGAGGGNGAGSSAVNEGLPSDLHTSNCGYYFEKYSVCAGVCPDGKCISEGRSCYCRKG